ncbi:cytochrome c oxidase subunit I [Sphaerobacter thermophilus]|uniref:Cytochrome c oxidase subunit 1 n=1 Tax=Sphaerobacter thermophilus (strain ATCC 49802 / DSM 20745 / KCCM 41009 / NCIMB 13125 / S 6022) TaxID=479434 RepID=D1C1F1_SPHTD|nr:cytochrome c oxidase subunit I [Sphaerobacter thermophilus]ACZ38068.1 cytochrome c oxidase, subunit I [Sphaerobacter thermophilus DSM 20745]
MTQPAVTLERRQPSLGSTIWSWITTVDHKRIGILYLFTSLSFFFVAGALALVIRAQLAVPDNTLVSPDAYNQVFTMHGLMMIFLVAMPLNAAFFNILVPLMIGARDVAFPRLNAFSYWAYLFGSILLLTSLVLGEAPNAGWFAYANLTSETFSPGRNLDFYTMSLQVLGVSSLASALNFFVTIVNMRAPGMTMLRMPLFVWMTFITSVLMLLAFPPLTIGLIELMFDRYFGTVFYQPAAAGDPVLWQHLFWIFGHPEVYILILPAFGVISEILPTFSRKPLFGYPFMVYSGIAIAFLSFGVWAHHMFAVGLGAIPNSVFGTTTMLIAIPTGVKIFNWLGTLWGGSIRITAPLLFAVGFVGMFTIGGISGVMHASVPVDYWQTDTYFVVAHFHYVLFGGTIMALLGGIYYWFPKIFGRMLNDRLGQVHFWLTLIFFNVTFFPMHFLGVDGMPRRIFTYASGMGWDLWNMVETVGAFGLGLSMLLLVYNVVTSLRSGERAKADPWDGRTLEWSIPSPPPEYNFAEIPHVRGRDDWWRRKQEIADGSAQPPATQPKAPIELPLPSYVPLLASLSLTIAAAGMVWQVYPVVGIGLALLLMSLVAWALEPNHPTGPAHHSAQPQPGSQPIQQPTSD